MSGTKNSPISVHTLKKLLVDTYPSLSPQLKRIAQHVLDHPSSVAVSTIADLSKNLGVQPSSFIRFSKALGFHGFSNIQRIIKSHFDDPEGSTSYFDRLKASPYASADTMGRFVSLAERSLKSVPSQQDIDLAAKIMSESKIIHVSGQRRAFAIASYLNYMLGQFDAKVNLHTFIGEMHEASLSFMQPQDCLVVISFPSYANMAVNTVAKAKENNLKIIAITDSLLSPIAPIADICLLCDQPTDSGFRSITASMITAQALAATYGKLKRASAQPSVT